MIRRTLMRTTLGGLSAFASIEDARGGAWTQKQGEAQAIVKLTLQGGALGDAVAYEHAIEAGLTDRLTILVKRLEEIAPASASAQGLVEYGVRMRLLEAFDGRLLVSIEHAVATLERVQWSPVGHDEFDVGPWSRMQIDVGSSFRMGGRWAFVNASAAHVALDGAETLKLDATAGIDLSARVKTILRYEASFDVDADRRASQAIEATLAVDLDEHMSLATSAQLWRDGDGDAPATFSIALWIKL